MGVLVIIIIIVFGYIMYKQDKQDKQDKLRRQKEAQEEAQKVAFEQEIKKKSEQWKSNPFFIKLSDFVTANIDKRIEKALTEKIGRSDTDYFFISCSFHETKIETRETSLFGWHFNKTISYNQLGFDVLPRDSNGATVASLNLALLQYLQKNYQTMPGISFSIYEKSLRDSIRGPASDGHLFCSIDHFTCSITKVHPLLEEITLP